ncbi:kinase-like domain-containing protein [Lactifluus subvellereus]|nr:kinase-like domain-containing protein [Lactifluus subvellereus]
MAHFDFSSYLSSLLSLPHDAITIQTLTGGVTNLTVRASFTPAITLTQFGASASSEEPLESVVLKYAPPFLPSDPTQPMSIYRQVIEAKALDILSGSTVPALCTLLEKFPTLRIPKLIHHDTEKNVLWITDLGNAKTLSDHLITSNSLPTPDNHLQEIATILGQFLPELYLSVRDPQPETLSVLSNPNRTVETFTLLATMTKSILVSADAPDADALSVRVERALQRIGTVEPCLGMCDLWPGSILIDTQGNCGLVDWEYFGLSGAGSEMGMLVAHLHIILLNSKSSQAALHQQDGILLALLGLVPLVHQVP